MGIYELGTGRAHNDQIVKKNFLWFLEIIILPIKDVLYF